MDLKEKKLYHQIHPLKLLTDWITGAISLYLLWFHQFIMAFIVMFIPAIVISFVVIRYVNLEKLKTTSLGNYMRVSMTKAMEVVRFLGFAIAALGALYHFIWVILCGIIIILFGWFRGTVVNKIDT